MMRTRQQTSALGSTDAQGFPQSVCTTLQQNLHRAENCLQWHRHSCLCSSLEYRIKTHRQECLCHYERDFVVYLGTIICFIAAILFFAIIFNPAPTIAQTTLPCDSTIKQLLFVIDVSGSMETNDRLTEVKQFALRTVRERSKDKLLFKLISYGGSCNDVQTDVDWTRDAAVINAGIKGLYLRGGTPLGSALEYTIDNVKKSAYPDQTLILLLNDGANGCGNVQDICSRRFREIPCVRINVLGIELQDDENNLADRALTDAEAISKATGGRFLPLNDVRELQGVSIADTGVTVRSVAFTPRKKAVKDSSLKTTAQASPTTTQASPTTTATTSPEPTPKKDTSQTLASNTRTEEKTLTEEKTQNTSNEGASSSSTKTTESTKTQPTRESTPEQSSQPTHSQTKPQTQQSSATQAEQSSEAEQPKSSKNKTSEKQIAEKRVVEKRVLEKQSPKKQRTTQISASTPSQARAEQQRSSASSQTSVYAPSKDSTQNAGAATEEGIILFYMPNSAVLLPQMKQGLERLVERLKQSGMPIQNVVVEGHSSIEGNSAANLRLSVERASGVAALLQSQLRLPAGRITWNAFGEVRPVAPNTTEAGRQENRRVEVRVIRYTQRAQ